MMWLGTRICMAADAADTDMTDLHGFYRLCKADIAGVFITQKIRAHPLKIRVIPEGIDKIGVHKTLLSS